MGNTEMVQTGQWGDDVDLDWTKEGLQDLRQKILGEHHLDDIVLMVFGNTGFGKSSLLNGFRSAIQDDDKVSSFFQVGKNAKGGSYTKVFTPAEYCHNGCKTTCTEECRTFFWTIDMPGTFTGLSRENIQKFATGEIPFYTQINEQLQPEEGYETLPPPDRVKASCVIVVLKCAQQLMDEMKQQLKELTDLCGKGVLSVYLILTFPDDVDPTLRLQDGLPKIFQSPEVRKAVEFASEETGIPASCIGVVRNFTNEQNTNTNTHILLLHALSNILNAARQNLERTQSYESLKRKLYKK